MTSEPIGFTGEAVRGGWLWELKEEAPAPVRGRGGWFVRKDDSWRSTKHSNLRLYVLTTPLTLFTFNAAIEGILFAASAGLCVYVYVCVCVLCHVSRVVDRVFDDGTFLMR